jgi:formylmethanofuran--tetrahydromethanopterin N-formyltransferase
MENQSEPMIDDTYAEAFAGLCTRVTVTAKDMTLLKKASFNSTALPSVVINRTEGGIEQWLPPRDTPDGRAGATLQFYGLYDPLSPQKSIDRFSRELSYRIRQGILVVPTTAVFNAFDSKEKIDTMDRVGHCGDGYETEINYKGRTIISIPLMMGDFYIERFLGYGQGVMGGNVWMLCDGEDSALEAGRAALEAIRNVPYVVTPFEICSAGSKPQSKFPEIGPTTNHYWCPSLRSRIEDSKVPESVNSIPEIVINGTSIEAVSHAMKAAVEAVRRIQGVLRISAGNYGGKMGQYKIYLRELS